MNTASGSARAPDRPSASPRGRAPAPARTPTDSASRTRRPRRGPRRRSRRAAPRAPGGAGRRIALNSAGDRSCRCRRRTSSPWPARRPTDAEALVVRDRRSRLRVDAAAVLRSLEAEAEAREGLVRVAEPRAVLAGVDAQRPVLVLAHAAHVELQRLPRPQASRICSGNIAGSPATRTPPA